VKTNTLPRRPDEIRSYAQLQRQIHDALRVEHPEWVEANGDCPTCESYESRLAELLGLSSPKKDRSVAWLPHHEKNENFGYEYRESCALASAKTRLALLARGDSTLVRHLQPVNWLNPRIARSVVCDVADQLAIVAETTYHRRNYE